MKRIDSTGSVNGRWVDKNPATGAPGTTLKADWFNNLQEEICSVIEEGAGLTLDGESTTQLLESIQKLVAERRISPRKFQAGQRGNFAFPNVQGLVECAATVQSGSPLTNVSLRINIEDNFNPAANGLTIRSWAYIFTTNFLPPPLEGLPTLTTVRFAQSTEFVEVDAYGIGTALFARFFEDDGTGPAGPTTSSGSCVFGKIKKASLANTTAGSLDGRWCILIRQNENNSDLITSNILCDFTYYA
jgi:hypothetical protein